MASSPSAAGVPRPVWLRMLGALHVLGGAAGLGFAAGRGLTRGYGYGFWFGTALVWGFPVALVAAGRATPGILIPLLFLACGAQALLLRARQRRLLGPALPGEARAWVARTLLLVLGVSSFGFFAHRMALAGVGHIEAGVLDDLRSFASAQEAYRAANGGFYDRRIECLGDPGSCVRGSAAERPFEPLLDREVVQRLTISRPSYWRFRLATAAGELTDGLERTTPRSSTSAGRYVLQASPIRPGSAGVRSFCVDWTGRLCSDETGRELPLRDGLCPPAPECRDL